MSPSANGYEGTMVIDADDEDGESIVRVRRRRRLSPEHDGRAGVERGRSRMKGDDLQQSVHENASSGECVGLQQQVRDLGKMATTVLPTHNPVASEPQPSPPLPQLPSPPPPPPSQPLSPALFNSGSKSPPRIPLMSDGGRDNNRTITVQIHAPAANPGTETISESGGLTKPLVIDTAADERKLGFDEHRGYVGISRTLSPGVLSDRE